MLNKPILAKFYPDKAIKDLLKENIDMPCLHVPPAWKSQTGGEVDFNVEIDTISSILRDFGERFPETRYRLLDENNRVYKYLNIFVNGELVARDKYEEFFVSGSCTIHVLSPLAGG